MGPGEKIVYKVYRDCIIVVSYPKSGKIAYLSEPFMVLFIFCPNGIEDFAETAPKQITSCSIFQKSEKNSSHLICPSGFNVSCPLSSRRDKAQTYIILHKKGLRQCFCKKRHIVSMTVTVTFEMQNRQGRYRFPADTLKYQ